MKSKRERGEKTFQVFLSFAKEDSSYGDKLSYLLSHYLNARVFTADLLSIGENWRKRLQDEISHTNLFVLLLSPNSFQSTWVWQELGAAWALQKPVLSVSTEPQLVTKLPVELRNVQYVDIKELEDPQSLHRIFGQYAEHWVAKENKGTLEAGECADDEVALEKS